MSISNHILVIDDEPDIRDLLEITIIKMGFDCTVAANLIQARELLHNNAYQLCILDMRLPDGDGLEFLKEILQQSSSTPVIMITAHGSVETATVALKAGAFDFLTKPVNLEQLRLQINSAINKVEDSEALATTTKLIGESASIVRLRKTINKVAKTQAPVLIEGEAGTGKELVARQIHQEGTRSSAAFIAVNCGAIPSELMESEFFGHVKGSFSGAHSDKKGLFQAAHGGTLFLDEIADLPLTMQVKLLRAIQERSVRPVGATEEEFVNIRLLSATHKSLSDMVANELFREDLFYRLNVINIPVPPLRDRSGDALLLANMMLGEFARQWNCEPHQLSEDASKALSHYHFPGNVRELENILERAATLAETSTIETTDLMLSSVKQPQVAARAELDDTFDFDAYMTEIERNVIKQALDKHRWNKTETASYLGLTFRQMRYKVSKLKLE